MHDNARGGDDTLIGGRLAQRPLGDAHVHGWRRRGGNDTLIGGAGCARNVLDGDAGFMYGNARGGNDTLIGGAMRSTP